jgi:PAS domain S-box-containing protein
VADRPEEELETLRKENKALRSQARKLERRLAETERVNVQVSAAATSASKRSAFMEKETLRREKYLNMLLDHCKDFFILLDEQTRIVYCSRNFAALTRRGYFDELRGQPFAELLQRFAGNRHKESAAICLKKVQGGEIISDELEEIDFLMNGNPGKYAVFAAPMYDAEHNFDGFLISYSDVTGLVEAREAAERATNAKTAFLARMSHEIRTPMNAIIGISKLALREELTAKARSYCRDVSSAANNLLGIINDILDFSKIESGKMEITAAEYQFASMINDVMTIIRVRLSDSPVKLIAKIEENIPGRLIGDEIRVRQILLNILSNAVKYTREGQIVFTVKANMAGNGIVSLIAEVADTGVGIKAEDMDKLFGDFTQLDTHKNAGVEGTGLGLAITRSLCRAMGGDVTVKSVYGAGSAFTATIPQKTEDSTPFSAVIDSGNDDEIKEDGVRFIAPAARILIVDDIATNLKVAEGLLAPYQARIDVITSGIEAVELVRGNEYDIVMMDHMMPGMDGIEATAAIRALPGERFEKLPIIALTANALSGMREMFLRNGFQDYLAKPIEISKLNEIMGKWVPREKRKKYVRKEQVDSASPKPEFLIEGVNTARGLAMTGGSTRQYQEVLALYCRDAADRLELLREAPDENGLALFTTQVHALKSASAGIGAAALSEEAAKLEVAGKRSDLEFIRENIDGFCERLSVLISRIRAALSSAKERRKADRRRSSDRREGNERRSGMDRRELAGSGAVDKDSLLSLKESLLKENIGAVDESLERLTTEYAHSKIERTLRQISDCVITSEFDAAVKMIDNLLSAANVTDSVEDK